MSGTIVVGYDAGEPAQRALERAVAEAKGSHRRLVVLSVVEMPLDPDAPRNFGMLGDGTPERLPPGAPAVLQPVLAAAHERVAAAGLHAEYLWSAGEPAAAILEVARERKASLIVLGAHHHGFLSGLFGTDVGSEVQERAGCDVLVVP